jgi:hypothetical protein
MIMAKQRKIYLAGALFSLREIWGNAIVRDAIGAGGKYLVHAPQDFLKPGTPKSLRDQCIRNLLDCDGVIVQFDGTELDSGTVVEFVLAKMAGIPCVALRTDLRVAGDQNGGDPWNLMCSFFPGVVTVKLDAAAVVHALGISHTKTELGSQVRVALDNAFAGRRIKAIDKKTILRLAGVGK